MKDALKNGVCERMGEGVGLGGETGEELGVKK